MIRTILWALAILGALLLLQTTALSYLVFFGAKPDILWVVFVILAAVNGSFASQIVGFVLGLAVDFITTAPLGFHAFQFSLAGYLFGLGTGKVYFDPIVVPALVGLLASVLSVLSGFFLTAVFRLGDPVQAYLHWGTLIQLVLNVVVAPVIYWLYGWIREQFQDVRRGFGG